MLELMLELLHPPSWYALYISIFLGLGVSLIYFTRVNLRVHHALAQTNSLYLGDHSIRLDYLLTIHHWLAYAIRRKESPSEDEGDHLNLLVS